MECFVQKAYLAKLNARVSRSQTDQPKFTINVNDSTFPCLGCFGGSLTAFAQTPVTITVTGVSGVTLPSDFIGLSFESGNLASTTTFPAENPVFRQMLAQIGPGLLRFGGNSVDKLTGWQATPRTSSTPSTVIASSDVDRVLALTRAVNWKILYSVGLGNADAASDADQAHYVAAKRRGRAVRIRNRQRA
jgi:hypothetical protein